MTDAFRPHRLVLGHRTDLADRLVLGHDGSPPVVSWQLPLLREGISQSAYRLQVRDADRRLVLDTKKVESDRCSFVPLELEPGLSGIRYNWQVKVWDEAGNESQWSRPAGWENGLLSPDDWAAKWLGPLDDGGGRTIGAPAPVLRHEFSLAHVVREARLHVAVLGLYSIRVNGAPVTADALAPGWCDYRHRVPSRTYSIGTLLRAGGNALVVTLGDGWYCGHIANLGRQIYGQASRMMLRLDVTLTDGRTVAITSGDPGWKQGTGPILLNDLVMGTHVDDRLGPPAWDVPGFDDSHWLRAQVAEPPTAPVVPATWPPVRVIDRIAPVEIREMPTASDTGCRVIIDFGQNLVGRMKVALRNVQEGQLVTLRHAEVLDEAGELYTASLRGAAATDSYTASGSDPVGETFEPLFTFHGFRFGEISGASVTPAAADVEAVVLSTNLAPAGAVECDQPLVNQLARNIEWGRRGNFLETFTDCPQRDERLGWTGDTQVFCRTGLLLSHATSLYDKWLTDAAHAQHENGALPCVIPALAGPDGLPRDASPGWSEACVIVPWELYRETGDVTLLQRHWPLIERFLGFLAARDPDGLCGDIGFGDWLAPDRWIGDLSPRGEAASPHDLSAADPRVGATPRPLIGTAFHAHAARLASEIAGALGLTSERDRLSRQHETARAAFRQHFVRDGQIQAPTQTAHVLALHFDLLEPADQPPAAEVLARLIREAGTTLRTGFLGTPYLLTVLTRFGHLELAYDLLLQTRCPSWLYPVTQGATTIWERWDGYTPEAGFADPLMNSFNHYAYGAVGQWLFETMAGLRPADGAKGWSRIEFAPQPDPAGRVRRASAWHETPAGRASIAWTAEADRLHIVAEVPPSAVGVLRIAGADSLKLGPGRHERTVEH